MPEAADVKKVRQEIDYNFDEFKGIVESKSFKKVFGGLYHSPEVSLSTVPKGYEKDNPAIEYLKFKSIIAERHIPDEQLTKGSLHKTTVNTFLALKPLIDFINTAVE